ncbi:unnamed protein product [Calicophoron daubneyi]|uniref:DUF4200 domain-containing protein n=1 Tax=Calicophoron daubneyi TaxID=300641 RepID=A0AAV2T5F5_CALDB
MLQSQPTPEEEGKSPSHEDYVPPPINYPTRKPFLRYLEELVNPKIWDDKPTLVKREQPNYLKAPEVKGNPFKFVKHERINQLKERDQLRKEEELDRFRSAHDVSEKLPYGLRQRNTAASKLYGLIHEENLQEIQKYGRLFGPTSLTAQPVGSKLIKMRPIQPQQQSGKLASSKSPEVNESPTALLDEIRSAESEMESKDQQLFKIDSDQKQTEKPPIKNKPSSPQSFQTSEPESKGIKKYEGVRDFVEDRRRVCLLELAVRTKRGEVKRLDTIIKAENDFLRKEEHELLRRHEEHDRYLKSICQRTAEAIRLAEGEALKRNEITERIKRARYRLAHLNAECVKLEEEYLRLSTYKDFLHKVAETFREHHTDFKKPGVNCEPVPPTATSKPLFKSADETEPKVEESKDESKSSEPGNSPSEGEASLIEFFTSPQDLVDILSELESNNLTLIENVQEQEEVCERVRAKAAKLYNLLNVERNIVDDHISREKQNIQGIQENVDSIGLARNALSDFVMLERYAKVFYLGDLNQFENAEPTLLELTAPTKTTGKEATNRISKLTAVKPDTPDVKPTISTLLSVLQVHAQKVYSAVYGTNEGGARLDTLVMLRRLETTVDELTEMLNAYPRAMVLKAKRTVDERNRVNARRRQKLESRIAYEKRLQKAILKAREPPRWRFGRRILQRSRPPEIKRMDQVGTVQDEPEEDNKSLFQ